MKTLSMKAKTCFVSMMLLAAACGHKAKQESPTPSVRAATVDHLSPSMDSMQEAVKRLAGKKNMTPAEIIAELAMVDKGVDTEQFLVSLDDILNLNCTVSAGCEITAKDPAGQAQ